MNIDQAMIVKDHSSTQDDPDRIIHGTKEPKEAVEITHAKTRNHLTP